MATGSSYPTSNDSFADKATGDFFTVADCNIRSSAIEKLEQGPIRLADGSMAGPAFSFMNDSDTGIYRSTTNTISFAAGGAEAFRFTASAGAVNFVSFLAQTAGSYPEIDIGGSDTNVGLIFDAKGAADFRFRTAAGATEAVRLTGNGLAFLGNLNHGFRHDTGSNIGYHVPATSNVHVFVFNTVNRHILGQENSAGYIQIVDEASADLSNSTANGAKLFLTDNGSGKTQLKVIFSSGAAQVIATQP